MLPLLLPPLLACACSLTDPTYRFGDDRRSGDAAAAAGADGENGRPRHLWVSAVAYPPDYNWLRDTARGTVSCQLVLLKDGERQLELPVREGGLSPDADTHRIVDGKLYTDRCTDGETEIACNGTPLFRYACEETVRGFLVDGEGRVHTLGQRRDGSGFSYRIDGAEIFSRPAGTVFGQAGSGMTRSGALYRDGADICFGFETPGRQYGLCVNGSVEEVILPEPEKVFDLRRVEGTVVAAFSSAGKGFRLLVGEALLEPASLLVLSARIVPDISGDWRVAVRYRERSGRECNALVSEDGVEAFYTGFSGTLEHVLLRGDDAFVATDGSGRVEAIRWPGGTLETMGEEERWLLIHPACLWMGGGDSWVALTAPPGGNPQIRRGDERTTLLLSGYLTGIVYE